MNVARDKIVTLTGRGRRGNGGGADGGAPGTDDWRDDLTRNRDGKIEATSWNLMLILEHDQDLRELFFLDQFANRVCLTRQPPWPGGSRDEFTDVDSSELAIWIGSPRRYGVSMKRDLVIDTVEAVARRRAKHPVREYLHGLTWDGVPRIEGMFGAMYGVDDTPYTRRVAQCFMTSAVARILWVDPQVAHNAAKVDFMVVLEGRQGAGKSSVVQELFGAQWFAASTESPSNKDFYQGIKGHWCIEVAEMESFNKADIGKIKQAITTRYDTYRASYGRIARSYRRECVFVGTTNEDRYLRDASGGRRFLPISVRVINVGMVRDLRDQLWAEAVALYRGGFKWWELPDDAAEQQEARFEADSWEDVINRWLDGKGGEKAYPPRLDPNVRAGPIEWVTTTEVLSWAIGLDVGKHGRPEQMRLAHAMKRLGWAQERTVHDGTRMRRWVHSGAEGPDVPF